MNKCLRTVSILVVAFAALVTLSCAGPESTVKDRPEDSARPLRAELPKLEKGDTWVSGVSSGGPLEKITVTITGEKPGAGGRIYTAEFATRIRKLPRPAIAYGEIDGETLELVRMEMDFPTGGNPGKAVTVYEYSYPGPKPFPLEIGKEWEVTRVAHKTIMTGGSVRTEKVEKRSRFRVVAPEEVTVPAGTFQSIRIEKYDPKGTLLGTKWVAEETRWISVKEIDYRLGAEYTLLEYRLR